MELTVHSHQFSSLCCTTRITMSELEQTKSSILQLVTFIIEKEEFGIDILNVQEIIKPVDITRVPNSSPYVKGVINLRGRIVPVVDLRARFHLPLRTPNKETRIVVVELEDKVVGFLMDAVKQVIRVDKAIIEPPPPQATSVDSNYLKGIAKLEDRLLTLLDLKILLGDTELSPTSTYPES